MILRAVLFILCCASIPFCNAQRKKSKQNQSQKRESITLFSVNKNPVTTDEFIYLYKKNHPNTAQDFTKEKIEEYLDLFINFKLKVEEAKKRGMDTTASFLKEFNQYKSELRKPYLPDSKLTDSLVRLTYDRMKEEVRASHILVSIQADAAPEDTLKAYERIMEIRNRIVGGEDFGKVAVDVSEDPSAKLNNGDLGYFTALQMVFPFENAAYETKVGEVSMPVKTRFGYHIIKVTDRRPAQGEVEVSHIMVRTGEDKSADQAKNKIFDIHDQLRAGLKWEDLCKTHSEDPGTKDNGGRLRPFGVGMMSAVPEFERVAFELQKPGEISDPFQTQYGWHILRLERKIPLQPFEELATNLKNRVSRDERSQTSKQIMQQRFRKQYQLSENLPVKTKAMAFADSGLQRGKWRMPTATSLEKEKLFSIKDKNYTVRDFFAYVQKNQTGNVLAPQKYFEQMYNNFIDASIIERLEDELVQNNPEFGYLLKEYYEGILLFEIMEKEVWNRASEDSVGQHRYYENNKAHYQAGERVRATFYSSSSQDLIESLKALVTEGKDQEITEFINKNKIRAESGFYKKEDRPFLKLISWEKGMYTTQNNGMYYLAWLKEILPAGTMSFEEARPTVVSDYQAHLEKNWINQLKKKFAVKVNEKGKQYILQQLQQK